MVGKPPGVAQLGAAQGDVGTVGFTIQRQIDEQVTAPAAAEDGKFPVE